MENETQLNFIASTDSNLRLCVIENSIYIEELVSYVIGAILDIDWKNSKSFGSKSTSLSFNQKVQLIMDIKGIGKTELTKFITLMHIRNKFAHVSEIQKFSDLFNKSSVGKEVEKNLHKWYFDDKNGTDVPENLKEQIYRFSFYGLLNDIGKILLNISGNHMFKLGEIAGKNEVNEKLTSKLFETMLEMEGGKEKITQILESLKNENSK